MHEKVRDYLQIQPGYVDTSLHQALAADAEFRFVNVAHWATPADFIASLQSPGFGEVAFALTGYRAHPAHPSLRRNS